MTDEFMKAVAHRAYQSGVRYGIHIGVFIGAAVGLLVAYAAVVLGLHS